MVAIFIISCGSLNAESEPGEAIIRIGNSGLAIHNVTSVTTGSVPGELVVHLKDETDHPLQSQVQALQDLVSAGNTELSKLERWRADRERLLAWIKAGVLGTIVFFIALSIYLITVARKMSRASVHAPRNSKEHLKELSQYYANLEYYVSKALGLVSMFSLVPAVMVAAVVVQHPSMADLIKSDAPLWPITASLSIPLVFFLSLFNSVHSRMIEVNEALLKT